MEQWLSNASANLVGSLLGAGFGLWLALLVDKRKTRNIERANSLQLIGALAIELRKLYDDMNDQYKGGQNTFDAPILESSAKQQVEVFADAPELLRSLAEIRRLAKLAAQKSYVAMLAHIDGTKGAYGQGPTHYERGLLDDLQTHKDHLKYALEYTLWEMAEILEHQIKNFSKEAITKGIVRKSNI